MRTRLAKRRLTEKDVIKILKKPDRRYIDTTTGNEVNIKKLFYGLENKEVALIYKKKGRKLELITVFPLREKLLKKRLLSGRWQ